MGEPIRLARAGEDLACLDPYPGTVASGPARIAHDRETHLVVTLTLELSGDRAAQVSFFRERDDTWAVRKIFLFLYYSISFLFDKHCPITE